MFILFFKSKKGKKIILFSVSFIFWIISVSYFISTVPRGIFPKNSYELKAFFVLLMLAISTDILFSVTFLEDKVLFKKLW